MPESVQLARLMGRGVTAITYTETGEQHRNNRPKIVYTAQGRTFEVEDGYANDTTAMAKSAIRKGR